jgi:adenosylhomocysteine nucleosidase
LKIIVTALRQEARPIIEALGLKQDAASRRIPVFSSGDTLLVISGIGKLLAGIATTHAMHLSGKSDECQLINIGMSGAVVDQIALGEVVTIHKIWDHSSGREFFPDMLLNYGLQEASLGTFDQPVTTANRPILACDVVDMEASGIFQAAQFFISPHQMLFLKVATDYLQFSSDDYAQMRRYYENSVDDWISILTDSEPLETRIEVISKEQEAFLNSVAESMRLTQTQTHQLRDAAMRFLVRGGEDLHIIKPNIMANPKHKVLRNQMFESIIRALKK